jgi:hypothetical protein
VTLRHGAGFHNVQFTLARAGAFAGGAATAPEPGRKQRDTARETGASRASNMPRAGAVSYASVSGPRIGRNPPGRETWRNHFRQICLK